MTLSEVADLYIVLRAITKPFTDAMAKAGAEGEATGAKISTGIGKVSPVIMGMAAATTTAMTVSVKWASDFETQYTRLYTAAGASKDAVLANRDAMLQLGSTTGFTGTQIAEALYHPVSAGLDLATALQVVKYSAEEARISGASLDDTTFSLSSVMKAFNINATNAGTTMAQLNAIVGDGDMRFQDFNGSIKNWAPTAAAMNISIQSMGSGLAYLTDRGASAEEASTRLTMGLTLMATPSAQAAKLLEGLGVASGDVHASTDLMTETLKKAHITQNQLALDLQKPDGLYVALTHLKTAMEAANVSSTEADSVISKIFGGGRSDKAILSLMQNLQGLKEKYDQIGKDSSANKFQQDWQDAQKTVGVAFDQLKASVINLGISFGEKLLPYVKDFLKWINDGIQFILHHREAMIALAGVITGVLVVALASLVDSLIAVAVAAAANPIVDILAAISLIAVEVITHWSAVKKFFEELWGWIQDHKDMIMVMLAVAFPALTAIGVAVYEVIAHWKELWAFLKRLGSDIAGWAKEVAGFFVRAWNEMIRGTKLAWDTAVGIVKGVWEDLKKAWQATISFLEKVWNDTGGKVVHEISQDWKKVSEAVSKEWDHIVGDLTDIWSSLVTIWNATGGKVVTAISEAFDGAVAIIKDDWTDIQNFFTSIWDFIYGIFDTALKEVKSVLEHAWNGITTVVRFVWNVIVNIISTIWRILVAVVKGYAEFLGGVLQAGWDAIKGAVQTVWDVITGIINTVLDLIKDILRMFVDIVTGKWGKLWDDFKKTVSDTWNNIWTTVTTFLGNILGTVAKMAKDIWNGFVKAILDILKDVGNALLNLWLHVITFFKDAGMWLYDVGKKIIQGLINGIKDMFGSVVAETVTIGQGIIDNMSKLFNFGSPSKTMHQYGMWIGQGLVNGIRSQHDAVSMAFGDMTSTFANPSINASFSGGSPVTSRGAYAPGTININVQGSVLTEKDLRDVVQTQMLQLGARYSTSYTPYKR